MKSKKSLSIIPVSLDVPVVPSDARKVDIVDLLVANHDFRNRDIVVIASKLVAILEGRCVALADIECSRVSRRIARTYGKDPELVELIRRQGRIAAVLPWGKMARARGRHKKRFLEQARTDLSPVEIDQLLKRHTHVFMVSKHGHLADSAGVDTSNVPDGFAVLLPQNPGRSAQRIRDGVREKTGKDVAVIITDTLGGHFSFTGAWDVPIGFAGIDPLERKMGSKDLFDRPTTGGRSNVVFPLAALAGSIMGNCDEATPVVVVSGFNYNDPPTPDAERGQNVEAIAKPRRIRYEQVLATGIESLRYLFVWLAAHTENPSHLKIKELATIAKQLLKWPPD